MGKAKEIWEIIKRKDWKEGDEVHAVKMNDSLLISNQLMEKLQPKLDELPRTNTLGDLLGVRILSTPYLPYIYHEVKKNATQEKGGMSKYNLSRKVITDIIPNEPISAEAIAGARYAFKYHNAEDADTLALNHEAAYELHKVMDRRYFDLETYQGLKIYYDPDLRDSEWRVRKTNEHIDAVEQL